MENQFYVQAQTKKKEGFSFLQIRVSQLLRFFLSLVVHLIVNVHVTFRLAFNYCRKVNNVMFNQKKKSERSFFLFSHPFFIFGRVNASHDDNHAKRPSSLARNEAISSFNLKPFFRSFISWKCEPRNQV